MATQLNRRWFAVASAPGTGNIAVGSAQSGYATLGAANDGQTFDGVTFLDGAAWEICNGCVYTHGTTTLTRGTREDSSTGGALTLGASTTVMLSVSASQITLLDIAMQSVIPGGRLTTESGVPVSTSDRTAQSTIYYTPFIHNTVPLWDGGKWLPVTFAETSLALSGLTSGKPYDVFGYLSSGVLALELLAWTDDTTRFEPVTLQDGRYCKSSDKTRLLLGTIYTTSTTATADAAATRYVGNVYNQQARRLFSCPAYSDGNSVTSYSHTSTTWAEANSGTGSRVSYILPLPAMATIGIQAVGDPGGATSIGAGIGDNSTSTASVELLGVTSTRISASTVSRFQKAAGKYYGALLLRVSGGTGTIYADNNRSGGASDPPLTHIHGEVMA